MDHATAAYLRANSRAWRLLRADSAPLILHVLGQIFIVDNVRTIAEPDLLSRVDDLLYAVNRTLRDPDTDTAAYPRTARAYVDTWADPAAGWLRKFYPDGSSVAHYDASLDSHFLQLGHARRLRPGGHEDDPARRDADRTAGLGRPLRFRAVGVSGRRQHGHGGRTAVGGG